jgi:hypothetical protein
MRFLALSAIALFSSLTVFACAASDHAIVEGGPASGTSPTDPATSVTDAASFCKAMCGREQTCDMSLDTQTCENTCSNTNAAVFPRLRTDVVNLIVGCFDDKDCKTVLGGGFVGACTADAIASVAPSAAAATFCDALATAKNKCSGEEASTKAQCLDSAKLYGDDAIAQAQNCVMRGCSEIDSCVAAVFGSLGGTTGTDIGTGTDGGATTSCSGKFSGLGSCETCAETSCCTETTSCYADASCRNIVDSCVNSGTSSTACSSAYSGSTTASQQLASTVFSCTQSKCTSGSPTCTL